MSAEPWLPFVGSKIIIEGISATITGGYVDACGCLLLDAETDTGLLLDNITTFGLESSLILPATPEQLAIFAKTADGFDD
jgi:hypothetical protein